MAIIRLYRTRAAIKCFAQTDRGTALSGSGGQKPEAGADQALMMSNTLKTPSRVVSIDPVGQLGRIAFVFAVCAACSSCASHAEGTEAQSVHAVSERVTQEDRSVMGATDLQTMTQAALADAARTKSLDASALRVVSAAKVTWSDSSLGCPKPGLGYTQALVRGYRIQVLAGEDVLDYHASERGRLFLCPPGRAKEPIPDSRM